MRPTDDRMVCDSRYMYDQMQKHGSRLSEKELAKEVMLNFCGSAYGKCKATPEAKGTKSRRQPKAAGKSISNATGTSHAPGLFHDALHHYM